MAEFVLSDRLAAARKLSQSSLSKWALATGISSSESFLLFDERLWGVRFSLGNFHARWKIDDNEILIYEANRLLDRIVLFDSSYRQVA
jgi:hypothetical protein